MSDGVFEMPYDLVKEDIEKSIRAKWRSLKREIRRSRRPRTVNSESRILKVAGRGGSYLRSSLIS